MRLPVVHSVYLDHCVPSITLCFCVTLDNYAKSTYASAYLEECSGDEQGSRCERSQIKSHTAPHFCYLDSTDKWSHSGDSFSQLSNTKVQYGRKKCKSPLQTLNPAYCHMRFVSATWYCTTPQPFLYHHFLSHCQEVLRCFLLFSRSSEGRQCS